MTLNSPERLSNASSQVSDATGESSPWLRALLENGFGNGGRRWRMSAGFAVQAAVLCLLLLLPLFVTERLASQMPRERTVVLVEVPQGLREGKTEPLDRGDSGQVLPMRESRPALSDLSSEVRPSVFDHDMNLSDGPTASGAPSGPGDPLWGDPAGTGPHIPGLNPVIPVVRPLEPRKPVVVGGDVRAPRLIRKTRPDYPALARQAQIQGDVILQALLGADGQVREVTVVRGHVLLTRAARQAVQQWEFEPTYLNGEPVAVLLEVVVQFRLNR